MRTRGVTLLLALGLVGTLSIIGGQIANGALPGTQQGYEPPQPIAYSHRLHAGELQIDCSYCHWGAERSRHAGIPAASICMNCHRFVRTSFELAEAEREAADREDRRVEPVTSPELQKLFDALGLDDRLRPDAEATPTPIAWTRVHDLPDFVYFDHRPHVRRGVTCQECHGPVETMERVRQVGDLSMGWCVNCHRAAPERFASQGQVHASIDCVTCHF